MIWTLLIGLLIGIVAQFLMPGRSRSGIIVTILLGIGGAMLSGWMGSAIGLYPYGAPARFISSVIGAMLILLVFRAVSVRTT